MTEVNHLIGNCAALYPRRAGSMGRAYPGHHVELVDAEGNPVPDGEPGEVVTPATSPTRFLGYLNNPGKEAEMRLGPGCGRMTSPCGMRTAISGTRGAATT